MKDYREIMRENAGRLRELNAEIDRPFGDGPLLSIHVKAHDIACAVFHSQYDSLAFPGGLREALQKLKTGDPCVVEAAIQYLEVKPRFFRSGYIAETILHRLRHVALTSSQVARLVSVVLDSIARGGRRRFHGAGGDQAVPG